MSYLKTIPHDMLMNILFLSPVETIPNLIQTFRHVSNILDENFYYNYIKHNFNCVDYGINEWTWNSFKEFSDITISYSWKDLLKLLKFGKFNPSVGINILPNDTINTIKQKIIYKNRLTSLRSHFNLILEGTINSNEIIPWFFIHDQSTIRIVGGNYEFFYLDERYDINTYFYKLKVKYNRIFNYSFTIRISNSN